MTGKLLTRLFALFGMTLTCVACYGVEYTEFHPEFGATGRVVDEQEQPIKGIKARCGGVQQNRFRGNLPRDNRKSLSLRWSYR